MISFDVKKFELLNNTYSDKLKFVIYSHSSFLDVLKIQIDYLTNIGDMILIINKNDEDLNEIYNNFEKVIFYDDSQTYGYRLLNTIKEIPYDYFIFIHDNDIVFHIDVEKVKSMFNFLRKNNYDRVDFQLAYDFDTLKGHEIMDDELYYIKSSNADTTNKGYPYNVNPSIWKKETLLDIMNKFGFRDYRTIEHPDTQNYAVNFNIFKLFSKNKFQCGYFICIEPFRYIHITHSQKYLNIDTLPNGSCDDIKDEYEKIVNKYSLKKSSKWM
jgi:hypothetical protein